MRICEVVIVTNNDHKNLRWFEEKDLDFFKKHRKIDITHILDDMKAYLLL